MSLEKIATASIIIVIINESKKERTQRKNHRPSFKTFIFNKTAFITFRTSHFIIFLLGSRTLPRQTVPRGRRTGGEGRTVENVLYTNQSSLFFIKTVTTDGRQKIWFDILFHCCSPLLLTLKGRAIWNCVFFGTGEYSLARSCRLQTSRQTVSNFRILAGTASVAIPAGNYMFKVNNRNTGTRCEICSELTIKTPERRWCFDGV